MSRKRSSQQACCDTAYMNKKPVQQDSNQLRRAAEVKLAGEQPPNVPNRSADELLHKLQVHQIELEMQNESLRQSHIEMEKSRDRYKDLCDFSPIGYLTLSHEGMILEANITGTDLLGAERSKLNKHRFANFVVPEDIDRWHQYFLNVLQSGEKQDCELSLKRVDDSRFDVHVNACRMEDGIGGYIVKITPTDITERKRIEEGLKLQAQILNSISDTVFLLNMEGDFVYLNEAGWKSRGYMRDEMMSMNLRALNAPEYNALIGSRFKDVLEKGYGSFESAHICKNGVRMPVEINARIIESGEKKLLLSVIRDITERKALEQQNGQYNQHIKALINATSESSFLLDTTGVVLAINDTALVRLRRNEEELLGKNLYDFLPPDIASKRRAMLLEVVKSRKPIKMEDERAGIKFLTTYTPIFDEAGKVVQVAVYAADVTERRQLEAIEQLLPAVNHKILEGAPFQQVLDLICEKTVEAFDLALVWAGKKMEDGSIAQLAASGPGQGFLRTLQAIGVRWDGTLRGQGPAGSAIRTGETQYCPASDATFSLWARAALEQGIGSSITVPLMVRGKIYGVFALYSKQATQFESFTVRNRIATLVEKICLAIEISNKQEQITLLSTALSSASNAVMITDPRGCIEWVNPAFVMLSGYSTAELLGRTPSILNSGKHNAKYYKALWQDILAGRVWSADATEKRKEGTLYTVQQTITPILDDKGEITHFVAIHEDVTSKLETQAHIQYAASHDGLTGLPNRALFFARLGQLFMLSKRNKTSLALMFIDLDGFKQVNDKLGHHIGDLLLKGVADRLLACVRNSDTVARLGGDEFTVTLFDISGRENIVNVVEKILSEMSRPFDLEGQHVVIGASIGIATATPERQISEDNLIERADSAMYEAKRAGKRCYRFAFEECSSAEMNWANKNKQGVGKFLY